MSLREVRKCDSCRREMPIEDSSGWRTIVGKERVDLCDACRSAVRAVSLRGEADAELQRILNVAWLVVNSAKTGGEAKDTYGPSMSIRQPG